MNLRPDQFSPTHCKYNDRVGKGLPHDWYQSHVKTDGGLTTSDICHNCRVTRINKWNGAVDYFWRMFDFLSIPAPKK